MQNKQTFPFLNKANMATGQRVRAGLISLVLLVLSFSAVGCRNGKNSVSSDGDTISMRFAKNIVMVEHKNYTEVILANPWRQGSVLQRYALVDSNHRDARIPEGFVRVNIPLHRCVVFTAAHMELIRMLGKTSSVKGVADAEYMHQPWLTSAISAGKITDCGNSMSPNIEKVMGIKPDAVLLSPYENSDYGRLEQLGVPLIQLADYMETSALGRAEWMRFYGRLFGCTTEADSLFEDVCRQYDKVRKLAAHAKTAPQVMTERKTGAVWYMPGGQSTMGQLFRDAHADYAFKDDKHSGSLPLSAETVIDKASNADVWILSYNGDFNFSALASEYSGYGRLKAFKTRNVYGCGVDKSRYFDEVPFRPDLLLRDLTIVFHPELRLGATRYYHLIK